MRLRYSFRFQQVGETYLGAAVGQNAHLFNGVLQLNEVGHFIVSELAELTNAEIKNTSTETTELTETEIKNTSTETTELTEKEILALLTDRLTKEYAVDHSTAQTAVRQVLDYLRAEQVIA